MIYRSLRARCFTFVVFSISVLMACVIPVRTKAKAAITHSKQRVVTQMVKDSVYADMEESEKLVASYLRELSIWWTYESPVFVYDEKDRPRVWTPDFYLPKLGMYVEVCGSENAKSYEYREQIYKKNEVYVIFVQVYKEEKKWKNYLVKRILEIEEVRHSGIVKMFHSLKF